ncbi:cryptochrome/photolyase family protein [Haladaptatus caseinilyticus]|uniref:cryptochrome/photolyase family protein n=1 Tax=Haladaptatus caseinilyticus TaxID=2993314 RepID=UPI00224AD0C1|nr:cryptochrome/photolyase family protein [Haladaptatus caseinilyticus]
MTVWVLGDQLTTATGPLTNAGDERILLVEAHDFARRMPYHPQKLTLLFSAMRHFRDERRNDGREVVYRQSETFLEALKAHFEVFPGDELRLMEPASHGAGNRLREIATEAGGTLELVPNDLFLVSPQAFDEWAGEDTTRFRHEQFYRWIRMQTGYLMDGDDPEGGEWNYDDANRESPPPEYEFPDPPSFDPDELTRETLAWVEREFETWGTADEFHWPVTREGTLDALDQFIQHRLADFGPYQDAMVGSEWALNHSILSSSVNLGLLHPRELIERAIAAYESDEAPLNSVEGFVRQVLGWREFMRHVYRRRMDEMAAANQLEAHRELSPLYYFGDTEMNCLSIAVDRVWKRGYSHHIERLMVLSNFALLIGASPRELNRWFHFAYVDAYHWVTTPNVVGMGVFATDALSTKPYASSGRYIDRMSDFCGNCRYNVNETTGPDACPFNALYWDFLVENEGQLRDNHRMALVYSNLDRKDEDEIDAIRERARTVREMAERETL